MQIYGSQPGIMAENYDYLATCLYHMKMFQIWDSFLNFWQKYEVQPGILADYKCGCGLKMNRFVIYRYEIH